MIERAVFPLAKPCSFSRSRSHFRLHKPPDLSPSLSVLGFYRFAEGERERERDPDREVHFNEAFFVFRWSLFDFCFWCLWLFFSLSFASDAFVFLLQSSISVSGVDDLLFLLPCVCPLLWFLGFGYDSSMEYVCFFCVGFKVLLTSM